MSGSKCFEPVLKFNCFYLSASSKTFVLAQKPNLLNGNHLLVWHKMFGTDTKCKSIFEPAQKFWTSPNYFGSVEGRGIKLGHLFNNQIILSRSRLVDTSLLIYFFGKRGDGDLGFDDFKKFMDNLQTEVLQMEYNEFAKGCATITEMDFARLIYSQVSYSDYLRQTQGLN